MLSAFKMKKFAAAMTFACAGVFTIAAPASANEFVRKDLNDMFDNIEQAQIQLQELGYAKADSAVSEQINKAREALDQTSDEQLARYENEVRQLAELDDQMLDALEAIAASKRAFNALPTGQRNMQVLASLAPSTEMTDVDTESLDLEWCANQAAFGLSIVPFRLGLIGAEAFAEVIPANINTAGQSVPNPAKLIAVTAKVVLKEALLALDEGYRQNGLCTLRNERKIAREYIQASQVRYTAHKTLEAKFDVVRPENLGGNKKYRYYFWMHVTEDGRATNANITKVLASQLDDENAEYVEVPASLYTVEHKGQGLYRLTFDTPTDAGLTFVRGFVVHLEDSHTSPGNSTYKHYGVGHIRSDVNSGSF